MTSTATPLIMIKAGDAFGRWVTLEDYTRGNRRILVRCKCGTVRRVPGQSAPLRRRKS